MQLTEEFSWSENSSWSESSCCLEASSSLDFLGAVKLWWIFFEWCTSIVALFLVGSHQLSLAVVQSHRCWRFSTLCKSPPASPQLSRLCHCHLINWPEKPNCKSHLRLLSCPLKVALKLYTCRPWATKSLWVYTYGKLSMYTAKDNKLGVNSQFLL